MDSNNKNPCSQKNIWAYTTRKGLILQDQNVGFSPLIIQPCSLLWL